MDGKEGEEYDGIMQGFPIFAPDSNFVAYVARSDNKNLLVANGKKGDKYDAIIISKGGRVVFDSSNSLHYLAIKGKNIFLVEEKTN